MKRLTLKSSLIAFVLPLLITFVACGGGTSSGAPPSGNPSTITLSAITVSSTVTGGMNAGDSRQMKANGKYSDGSTKDLTSSVTWATSNGAIASVSSSGMVTANSGGSANISATYYTGVAGSLGVSVNATVKSVSLSPANPTLTVAGTLQMGASATYTDNGSHDVTSSATWSSSNTLVATVSSTGLVTAVAGGSATISATYNGVIGTTGATVKSSAISVVGIAVSPANGSVALGSTLQMSATATYSDLSTADVTGQAAWASSNTNFATVSANGLVTSVATGSLQITATLNSVVGTASLDVRPQLVSIAILPATPSIQPNNTQQFTASGTFSDQSQQDLTSQVTWSSSTTSVGTIDSTGLATGVAAGSTTITATLNSVSATDTLTVSNTPTLSSILVDQDGDTVPLGVPVQLTATGVYSDNSTAPLVGVTFTSSDPTTVSIDANGVASTLAVGNVTVTATLGSASGTGLLTVGPQTLVSISVTPTTLSVPVGLQQQFTATGTFTDSSTQVLSNGVVWASSDPTVATVDQNGNIVAIAVGTTNITATVGPIVSNIGALSVTNATLVSIAITPNTATMPATVTQQFTATGTYSDSTTLDLTASTTWVSSNGAVATVSADGLALGVTPGTVTITASSDGVSGTASLTIDTATIVSIAVSPANDTVTKGTHIHYSATATFSDSSTQDITHLCSWSSSKPSVAHINGAGLARAHKKGTVSIRAKYDGVLGSTSLTVN